MEIIDKNFQKLSKKRKTFVVSIALGHFLVGLIGYVSGFTNLVESFLLFIVGIFFAEMLKMNYRILELEKKNK